MQLKKLSILSASLFLATIPINSFSAYTQTGSGENDGYRLVWQDLFDGTELNTNRWNIEVNDQGGGNNELQYYTNRTENVRVGKDARGNGCLILTARREDYKTRQITSGRVNSKNLFSFKHGKVEASICLPKTAKGLWPAFWMMGSDYDAVGWPKCGETDILEMGHSNGFNNGTSERFFNGAMHWGEKWPQASYAKDNTKDYSLQDGEFHLFTLIWDEDKVEMYVDLDRQPKQVPYFRMTIPKSDAEWDPGKYFHKENFIIFNLAVGGNFPGIFNAAEITALNDENSNQASMYINFVKVYQKDGVDNSMTMKTPGDPNPSTVEPPVIVQGPWLQPIADQTANGVFDVITLNDNCIEKLKQAGKKVNLLGPDQQTRNLWIWENTYKTVSPTFPGIGWDQRDGLSYISLDVASDQWSGAGFHIASPGADLSHFSAATRLHIAYRTNTSAPQSLAFKILDLDDVNTPACFACGDKFIDNGVEFPSVAPKPSSEWQGLDITLGELQQKFPQFNLASSCPNAFTGNILSFLAGNNLGDNVSLDAIYFYGPVSTAADAIGFDDFHLVFTGRTLNAAGAPWIRLFNLTGQLVKVAFSTVMDLSAIPSGTYIATTPNHSLKICLK